jgi:hypothetical protein
MTRKSINTPEWLHATAFLIYLIGSSLGLIENGSELSLWIMAMALVITISVTVLPTLGIQWLRDDHHSRKVTWWIALMIQVSSWGSFVFAVYKRVRSNLPSFQSWLIFTTLLWAIWLLIFLFTRTSTTQRQEPNPSPPDQREDL